MRAMTRWIHHFGVIVGMAAVAGCSGSTGVSSPQPSEIVALERQMWDDWKNQRYEAMGNRMSADAVMLGAEGITNRAGALAAMTRAACQAQSYSLDEPKVTILAPTAAMISYTAKVVGTCAGQAIPSAGSVYSSTWSKQNGNWITVMHQETPIAR